MHFCIVIIKRIQALESISQKASMDDSDIITEQKLSL